MIAVWFCLWSVFLVVMTLVVSHAIMEHTKHRNDKQPSFRRLNVRPK